jgi:alanine transaminase
MISFHSISKGFLGECGIRGGYFELYNMDPTIKANMYKLASISLCANTHGQVGVGAELGKPELHRVPSASSLSVLSEGEAKEGRG